jgi:hypothetical protein
MLLLLLLLILYHLDISIVLVTFILVVFFLFLILILHRCVTILALITFLEKSVYVFELAPIARIRLLLDEGRVKACETVAAAILTQCDILT